VRIVINIINYHDPHSRILYNNLAFATKSDFFSPDPGVFCGQMRPIFQTVQYFRLL